MNAVTFKLIGTTIFSCALIFILNMRNTKTIFSKIAPNPKEYMYWVDLTADKYGKIIKIFTGNKWESIIGLSIDGDQVKGLSYSDLIDKPTINGVTVAGDISLDQIGAITHTEVEPIIADKYIDETELQESINNIEVSGGTWSDVQ